MKRSSILALFLMLALSLSACRGEATSTAAPIDLQGTIAAAAFTVIAQTQEAIPTSTPVPPTATFTDTPIPLPTNTLPPLPPPGVTFTPAPNSNASGEDPCIYKTLPEKLTGDPVRMRLDNSTKVALSVTVYLNHTEPNGQCGYRSYTIEPGQNVVINNLVEGCYTLWAWNPDPNNYFIVTNGTNCVDASDSWAFNISTSSIKLAQ